MTAINKDAFKSCYRLENIAIPKHCTYLNSTFSDEGQENWNHLDRIIKEEGPEWLKHRFNNLPFHQLCYDKDITIDELADIPVDDPLLKSVDQMNMTPLHVLSYNPNATLEMIQALASKYPDAAFVETKNALLPVDLYYTIHHLIEYVVGFDEKLWNILLACQGSSVNKLLSSHDKITGLIPFMTAAVVNEQPLDLVYKLAIMDDSHTASIKYPVSTISPSTN